MGILDIFKIKQFKRQIQEQTEEYYRLLQHNQFLVNKLNFIGADRYDQVTDLVNQKLAEKEEVDKQFRTDVQNYNDQISELRNNVRVAKIDFETESQRLQELKKKSERQDKRIVKSAEIYRSLSHAVKRLGTSESINSYDPNLAADLDDLYPSVILRLHHMDVKNLRQAFRSNDSQINKVLNVYQNRYTTKANQSIYQLMVLGLRSELQNILYNLKYGKLDDSVQKVKELTAKYRTIADDGNQSIARTLISFIDEIEYLFINAVKIEFNYYVKKQQEKEERMALRQQLKEEAEERKRLLLEKKRIQEEETKYLQELERNRNLLNSSSNIDEIALYQQRILELEGQLSDVTLKKEEISSLEHGKAGTVYIISNKGAFGDNIFKIGMTRRLDPMDRINELGSASVPFRFDVHSLIFSKDAVTLENELHKRLSNRRVNKVNFRKEFFNATIEELESVVNDVDPTAEFVSVMEAEEYNQSLSSEENYDVQLDDDDELDDEIEDVTESE